MLLERWNRQFMVSEGIRFDERTAFFPMTTLNLGSICLDIRLLGNFPVSQVIGYRFTLLAGNYSISLAESEEQKTFSQKSPKMLKMASESFVHFLLLLLGLFSKFPAGCPCSKNFFFLGNSRLFSLSSAIIFFDSLEGSSYRESTVTAVFVEF